MSIVNRMNGNEKTSRKRERMWIYLCIYDIMKLAEAGVGHHANAW